jgi:hypothetical protein
VGRGRQVRFRPPGVLGIAGRLPPSSDTEAVTQAPSSPGLRPGRRSRARMKRVHRREAPEPGRCGALGRGPVPQGASSIPSATSLRGYPLPLTESRASRARRALAIFPVSERLQRRHRRRSWRPRSALPGPGPRCGRPPGSSPGRRDSRTVHTGPRNRDGRRPGQDFSRNCW